MSISVAVTFVVPFLAALSLALPASAFAQALTRTDVDERYRWNPSDIYSSDDEWRAAKDAVAARIPDFARYEGTLGSSASALADALDALYDVDQQLNQVFTYIGLLADQDTRESRYRGMRQEAVQVSTDLGTATAFLRPEILEIDDATLARFVATEPRLEVYAHFLEDLVRRGPHTLSESEEGLLAASGPLAGSPRAIYDVFTNSDFPYPVVTLSDGRKERLTPAAFADIRAVPNRADRATVMEAFFGAHGDFGSTFGTIMNGNVQKNLFRARSRGYESNLELALDDANIPVAVYSRLIEGINRHLPKFHRYLELRKRMMGLDELHYYDLYAPLVESVDLTYSPEEAVALVREAVAPLGADYQATIQRSFDDRWIDWYPTAGKRSGAYSSGGAYAVHPYVLLNYSGRYDDVSTVAHELGHAMHSFLSNRTQPYAMAGYPIFLAEVASTFNESLLIDHMLDTVTDPEVRLSVLGSYLENIKGTVVRQTQFAEFELRMHEMAERGEPITGDSLAELYLEITRKYYGHDEGVTIVDDYVANEWSYVPHFYRDFYVFQYATSFTAAEALAQKVKAGDAAATERYLTFLSSGESAYPIDLLREAGVDMTSDEPLDLVMREMARVMNEMEEILDGQASVR